MEKNLYQELGLKKNATKSEIKSSYRSLVKKHHPDAGGEKERFLAIQNAWEILNDPIKKEQYDRNFSSSSLSFDSLNKNWEEKFNSKKYNASIKDKEVETWIKEIYTPINVLISQIISPLNNEIKELINKRLIVILPSFGERYLSTAMFESNTSIQARKDGYL